MSERAWLYGRYALFQLPGLFVAGVVLWGLVRWTELTPGLAALLLCLWVLKDVALFPVTRIAYERGDPVHGAEALRGTLGRTRDALEPGATGYVQLGSELWRAELAEGEPTLGADAPVRVVGVRGLTLLVEGAAS